MIYFIAPAIVLVWLFLAFYAGMKYERSAWLDDLCKRRKWQPRIVRL